jgi:hypothetical protein
VSVSTLHYTDPELVEAVEPVAVTLAEREPPSPELADLVEALATMAPEQDVQAKLTAAAEAVWSNDVRARVESALAADIDALPGENPAALALAFTATLPLLACDERIQGPLGSSRRRSRSSTRTIGSGSGSSSRARPHRPSGSISS